jgi:hypothetical protein
MDPTAEEQLELTSVPLLCVSGQESRKTCSHECLHHSEASHNVSGRSPSSLINRGTAPCAISGNHRLSTQPTHQLTAHFHSSGDLYIPFAEQLANCAHYQHTKVPIPQHQTRRYHLHFLFKQTRSPQQSCQNLSTQCGTIS